MSRLLRPAAGAADQEGRARGGLAGPSSRSQAHTTPRGKAAMQPARRSLRLAWTQAMHLRVSSVSSGNSRRRENKELVTRS